MRKIVFLYEAIIRTNSGTLTINAASDTVNHYGYAEVLDIQAIAGASYHENGTSGFARIAKGHFVVESEGVVNVLYATGTKTGATTVQVDNNNGIIGKAYATDDSVANEENNTPRQAGNIVLVKDSSVEAVIYAVTAENIVEELANPSSEVKEALDTIVENSILRGDGTQASPYIISNKQELLALRDKINEGKFLGNKYYKLTANIDLTGEMWLPIGTFKHPFNGVFDGDNHTIKGLSGDNTVVTEFFTTDTTQVYGAAYGFIAVAGNGDVTVKNIVFTDVNINLPSTGNCVGTMIGYAPQNSDFSGPKAKAGGVGEGNTASSNITIQNISVSGSKFSVKDCAGGIMGKAYNTGLLVIQGCTTNIEVIANDGRAAGICGYVSGPTSVRVTGNTLKKDVYAAKTVVDKVAAFTCIGKDYVYDNNTTTGMKAYFKVNNEFVEQVDCYSLNYTYENDVVQSVEFTQDISKVKYTDNASARVPNFMDGTIINNVTAKTALTLKGNIIVNYIDNYNIDSFHVYGNLTLNDGRFGNDSQNTLLTIYKGGTLTINGGDFGESSKICNNGTVYLNHLNSFSEGIINYHIQGDNTGTYYMNCVGDFYTQYYLNSVHETIEKTFTDDSNRYTYIIGQGLSFEITDDSDTVGTYRHLNISNDN